MFHVKVEPTESGLPDDLCHRRAGKRNAERAQTHLTFTQPSGQGVLPNVDGFSRPVSRHFEFSDPSLRAVCSSISARQSHETPTQHPVCFSRDSCTTLTFVNTSTGMPKGSGVVAVGPPVTRRPPHRSLRAELPHKAPASGRNAQTRFIHRLTYPFQRTLQPSPALNPLASLLAQIAFGQPPFLHQLRRRTLPPNFVRRFLRYYRVVRLLRFVHRMLVPLGFHARTHRTPLRRANPETSRLPCEKCRHMPWFFDRAGAMRASSWRRARCCLPLTIRKSASRKDISISRLNSSACGFPCQRFKCALTNTFT